jgi:putative DNA primase/helicase
MTPRTNAKDLSRALAGQIEQVCSALGLGDPTNRTGHELRYRGKGSLAVTVKGEYRGWFNDYEAGEKGDTLALIKHVLTCDFKTALAWGVQFLGGDIGPALKRADLHAKTTPPADLKAERDAKRKRALSIWDDAVPITGTLAETYLLNRVGELPAHDLSHALRFHPSLPYAGGRHPALVALMQDPVTDETRGIHRTFLTDQAGKHPIGKRMLGGTGVIFIWPPEMVTDGLVISEGIETGLAGYALYKYAPLWVCCDAGGMAKFPLIGGVTALTVFADHDEKSGTGEAAALAVCDRWVSAGREAGYIITKAPGDLADLTAGGTNAA